MLCRDSKRGKRPAGVANSRVSFPAVVAAQAGRGAGRASAARARGRLRGLDLHERLLLFLIEPMIAKMILPLAGGGDCSGPNIDDPSPPGSSQKRHVGSAGR
jgi:hypothetical protein